ncbi:MAG TPA: TonB-dependent receptor [Opitutaceae bacterium]|nr:TonB-dependent receptor [Opitutaceae bacterium]
MKFFSIKSLWAGLLALGLTFAGTVFGQGITTAALNGFVTGNDGKPLANATVTVVHQPTGTTAVTTTRGNGQFNLSGLRVGGPYSVSAAVPGYRTETREDVYLDLGSASATNFSLNPETAVVMEAFKVQSQRDLTFDSGKFGTGSSFDSQQIIDTATIRRNIQDVAALDSRLFLNSLDQGGQLSAQGQNFRFNSLLIDGVQANDPFGLNSSGFSSLRSPIPLEALQSLSIELNPYDVRRSGFTGALINAVTKSGTNEFSGMLYGEYTDLHDRGKNPVSGVHEFFRERTYGGTFGGPIWRDHIWFFVAEDDFRRTTLAPAQQFVPDATQVQQVVTRAKALGYDPGTFTGAAGFSIQKSYVAKLDWNINSSHRLALQYRDNYGTSPIYTNFSSSGTTTSFSNYWYDAPLHSHGYTAQLFDNWAPNLRTEFSIGHTAYDGSPRPHGAAFPEVFVRGVSGVNISNGVPTTSGQLDLGTDNARQLNGIVTKTDNLAASAEYSIGAHTITFGGDYEKKQVWDAFVSGYYGSYTFATVSDWLAGTGSLVQLTLSPGTTIQDALAVYTYTQRGLYVQDLWKPNEGLTVNAGIRFDDPYVPKAPIPIPTTTAFSEAAFQSAFGMKSTTTNSGNYSFSPRVGFNYDLPTDRKTQIRGGIGLFQGTNPSVWLGNPYQNRGVTSVGTTPGVTFSPTITPPKVGPPGLATVNVTDPSFRPPLSWKSNLAVDHTLPFGGLILTAEADFVQVQRALNTIDLNLKPVGTMPDGRIRYAGNIVASTSGSRGTSNSNPYSVASNYLNAGFGDVLYLTNTNKGGGHDFTLSLKRPFMNNWSFSLSWTHSHYTEVSPATSSIAQSNYNGRKVTNSNEDVASISNTNVPDRIVSTLTYQFHWLKNAPTSFALIYQGRTGHNYSWTFFGDANGDGFTFNDLFYMPTGPSDPKVRWNSTTERDNFFAYAQSSGLTRYAGQIVPRNSETSPWVQTVDLKFTQAIPIYKRVKSELFVNLINLSNLLNRKWGIQTEDQFSYGRAVAGATYDPVANQYIYTFTPNTLNALTVVGGTIGSDQPASRWQVQTGMRIRF